MVITLLMLAVAVGDEMITEMLVAKGAKINEKDKHGNTHCIMV